MQYVGMTARHLFAIPAKAGSRDLARLFIEDDPAITAGRGNGGLSDKMNHIRSMARWPPGSSAACRKICLLTFKLTHYLAFAVMVAADLVMLYATDLPPRIGIIATVLAIVGAVKFTSWYPERAPAN
jgi:hypothetical protein